MANQIKITYDPPGQIKENIYYHGIIELRKVKALMLGIIIAMYWLLGMYGCNKNGR